MTRKELVDYLWCAAIMGGTYLAIALWCAAIAAVRAILTGG